jgi:TetR/AcrR family transcriptional regulator, repressor for neighboring sulfatase
VSGNGDQHEPESTTADGRRPSGRDEVVEALLDAANRLFAAKGPADVSLRAIAREANVNHGMVHRHFGTRDDLVDRLLERMAANWTAFAQSADDFTAAVEPMLGQDDSAESSAGAWLRLLAWSLLTEAPAASGAVQRRYATLDLLPAMLTDREPDDAAATTAAALALVYGWRFFHPYIRSTLHLEDVDFATLQEAIRDNLRKIIAPERRRPG